MLTCRDTDVAVTLSEPVLRMDCRVKPGNDESEKSFSRRIRTPFSQRAGDGWVKGVAAWRRRAAEPLIWIGLQSNLCSPALVIARSDSDEAIQTPRRPPWIASLTLAMTKRKIILAA